MAYWEVKYPFPLSNRDVSFLLSVSFFAVSVSCGSQAPTSHWGPLISRLLRTTLSWILVEPPAKVAAAGVTFRDFRVRFP